jgi:hypothetical protein
MSKKVLVACVLGALAAASIVSPSSAATYFCNPCGITVWELNPVPLAQQNIGGAVQQANTSNPLFTGAQAPTVTGTGTYTGLLNLILNAPVGGQTTIGSFLSSAGGTNTLSSAVLNATLSSSTPAFSITTLFEFTGNIGSSTASGTINHDDGASLYDGSTPFSNVVASSPTPTTDIPTTFSGLTGAWQLLYVEANGLPADLDLEATPLPSTWVMLLAALAGLAFFAYRRKDNLSPSTLAA